MFLATPPLARAPACPSKALELTQQGQGQGLGQGQGQGSGTPPQEAIDACVGLTQDAACSITTPNGVVSGTCGTPPNSSQMACMPAGGRP